METGFYSNAHYKLQTGDLGTCGTQPLQVRAAGSETVAQAFPSVETNHQIVMALQCSMQFEQDCHFSGSMTPC